jgi:F0F1-type ATP synthase assembly protein I
MLAGLLHAVGAFETGDLTGEELAGITEKKSWFWLGEVLMASVLAGIMAVPAGMYFATITEAPLAIIGSAVVFLPLFIFIPKLLREAREVDAGAVIEAFGKNEQMKKVFWTLFLALAGLVLARIADPVTAQKVIGVLTGAGV